MGFSILSLIFAFQNCSNAKFTNQNGADMLLSIGGNDNGGGGSGGGGGDNSTGSGGNGGNDGSCRPTEVVSTKTVKVLFLVDTSGSNLSEGRTLGTDPQKKWRQTTLNGFINKYSSKSNFHYGLITFQGSSAKAQIASGGKAVFTNSLAEVQNGVTQFMNTDDAGKTPYKAALNAAKAVIQEDLAVNSSQQISYVLVMVSDGQATDYGSPAEIIPDAHSIKNLAPSQISLNSVYYYSSKMREEETKYLRNLSTIGGGSFITANSNTVLNIDDVIRVPGTSCQ